MGRRFNKKIVTNGTTSSHVYYLYHSYLQIAEINLMYPKPILEKSYLWELHGLTGTRLLMMTKWKENETAVKEHLYFMHDAMKNVTSIFDGQQMKRVQYEYAPFGSLLITKGDMARENKFRFSCEFSDDELGLVYYNYRHLNPFDGRWINRDPIQEKGGWNLYRIIKNMINMAWDSLGMASCSAFDPQFGYSTPPCSLRKTEGWSETWLDFVRWVVAVHPGKTEHIENSEQSLLIKNSSIGKKLIDGFLKKNKNRKKCWEWEGYTNVKLKFGPNEFIRDLPNGRAHFVGSGRGDVSLEVDLKLSKIIAHFQVENTTSLTSFLYGIGP